MCSLVPNLIVRQVSSIVPSVSVRVSSLHSTHYEVLHPIIPNLLGDLVLQQEGVPLLLRHLKDIQWSLLVYFSNDREEFFAIERWKAWILN